MASLVQDQVRSKPVGSSVISMTSSATSTTNCSASVVNTSHQLTLLISSFSFPTTCCKFHGNVWGYLVKLKTRQRNDNLDNAITREEAMRSLEASLVRVRPHITNEDFESIVTKAGRCSCYLVLLCGCAPYWRLTMSSSGCRQRPQATQEPKETGQRSKLKRRSKVAGAEIQGE